MSLQEQRESLRHLTKSDLLELATLHSQHKSLDRLFHAIAIIFSLPATPNSYQSLLSESTLFDTLINLKPSDLTPVILEKLKPILEDPNLTDDTVKEISEPGYYVFKWVKALYNQCSNPQDLPDLDKEMEKLQIISDEDYQIPASLDDLNVENRNLRATDLKTEYQLAQNLLDDVISECRDLGSLSHVKNPTEKVVKLVKAMCILLGEEPTWERGFEILSDCEAFNKKAKALDIDKLPMKRVNAVRVLLQDPELRMANIENDAPELTTILMWITTVVNYCVMMNYIESGEICLSESAEEEAVKQESRIIESFSRLLDEGETENKLTAEERVRLRELEKVASLEDF